MEKVALAKKLCLTARTDKEDTAARAKEADIDAELDALLDDDFLESYMARRMREMMSKTNQTRRFGQVLNLPDADSFLSQIDGEEKSVTVIIMIYEPGAEGCPAMSGCVENLAGDFPTVKFCKILSTAAGLSKHFKASGVPALLVYKAGQVLLLLLLVHLLCSCTYPPPPPSSPQILGSFVRMTEQLGTDFFASDVESLLLEHGLLPDREARPACIRGAQEGEDSDGE